MKNTGRSKFEAAAEVKSCVMIALVNFVLCDWSKRAVCVPAFRMPVDPKGIAAAMSAPIKVPAMMIHGRDDGCIGAELLEGMEKLFPAGLKKEVVKGAGHFVHQERPELVNEVVVKFLKG